MSDIIILAIVLLFFNSYINIYDKVPFIRIISAWSLLIISFYIVVKEVIRIVKKKSNRTASLRKTSQINPETFENLMETINYRDFDRNIKAGKKEKFVLFKGTFKEQFSIAFISGLAPCLTGWTIFMLIVSSGNLWLLLPATIAFGIGVFSVLLFFAYLVNIFKEKVISKFEGVSLYAPVVSGIFLLITSLFLII